MLWEDVSGGASAIMLVYIKPGTKRQAKKMTQCGILWGIRILVVSLQTHIIQNIFR
jgi:hypothetical protein